MTTELYPFQQDAVQVMGSKNFLLADKCGLGKTLMAVHAMLGTIDGDVLILCRRTAKPWWRQVLIEEGVPRHKIQVCEQAGRGLDFTGATPGTIFIMHHEAITGMAPTIRRHPYLELIIVDEAHRFKNRNAQRTVALKSIKCNRKWALTATPYGKNPADMWSILHWLYPGTYTSYWKFFDKYVDAYRRYGENYHIIRGGKNLDGLAREIATFTLARTKDDAGIKLPQFIDTDTNVRFERKQDNLYTEILRDRYAYIGQQEIVIENALSLLVRLHQTSLDPGMFVEWEEHPGKVNWLVEWIEDHQDEPVIVACRYRRFITRYLKALNWSTVVGGLTDMQLEDELHKFADSGRMVGTIDTISESLNLQKASTIIVPDGTWSAETEYQLSQRIHRIGQTRTCNLIHLVGMRRNDRPSVDVLARAAVQRRLTEQEVLMQFVKEVRHEDSLA